VSVLYKGLLRTAQKTPSNSVTHNQSVNVVQGKSPYRTLQRNVRPCRIFYCYSWWYV